MENPAKQHENPPSKGEDSAEKPKFAPSEAKAIPSEVKTATSDAKAPPKPAGLGGRPISPQSLGLKVLSDPPDDDTEFDIIAVHGIGVNPLETWVHPVTKVNWLSDKTMLPSTFPSARIMAFGYHSVWFGENASKQTLDGVATSLLNRLERMRQNCSNRPIIFIGHCFGGLVIQQLYVAALGNPDYPGVANAISGLIFLGTPHFGVSEGGGLSTQGQIYEAIVQSGVQIQDNIMHSMAQDTDLLINTVTYFTRRVSTATPPPKLFCFYERMTTNTGLIVRKNLPKEFVVNETSGTLPGHQKEGLVLDHFSMNKFESADDDNYQAVQFQIEKMVKEIKGRVNEPEIKESKTGSRKRSHIPNTSAPIAREDKFAGRDGILERINNGFHKTACMALYGPSGSGKTHIAVEYAHLFHDKHPEAQVFWVNANSAEQFELSYKRIDEALRLPRDTGESASVVERVYNYLKRDSAGHWVMILDGLEKQEDLMTKNPIYQKKSLLEFLPNSFSARILVTTRSKSLASQMVAGNAEHMVKVAPLSSEDASYLLLGRATSEQGKKKWVENMSQILENLAGAMILVPAYMGNAGKDCNRELYLKKIEEHAAKYQSKSQVPSVWVLLYDLLTVKHSQTAELLLRICTLEVQCIPAEFFSRSEVWEQIPILTKYGLVEPSTDGLWFTVTALFRSWAKDWLKEHREEGESSEEAVLSLMVKKFTDITSEPLLPCALSALGFKPASAQAKRDMSTLFFKVSEHYVRTEQYSTAGKMLKRSLSLREKDIDSDEKTAWIKKIKEAIKEVKNLDSKEGGARKTNPAGTKMVKASDNLKKLEASDSEWKHRDTARQASNLAAMQLTQSSKGGSKDAVVLYKRLLKWSDEEETPGYTEKAHYQYNLALAHDAEGEYQEAEVHYNSALALLSSQEESKVPDHNLSAFYLKIMSSLAGMHCRQGQLHKAEAAFRVVFPAQRDLLGLDHPETLTTRHNMTLLMQKLGYLEPAGEEMRRVLNKQMHLLEPNDPAIFRTACSLALNYRLNKKYPEARKMYKAVLESQESILGDKHRDTVDTRLMLEELTQVMKGRARHVE